MPVLVLSGTVASPALADTWSPPPGAVDLLFSGSATSSASTSVTPVSADPSPTQRGGLTSVAGLSIGRIPDVGTYVLSSRPTAGQVYADPGGTCSSIYTTVTGTIVVHELRYADDGTLQQIAAEVTRTCGTSLSLVWRWHSAVPYPRLDVTAPPAASSDVGPSWTGDWTVRNTGTGPVTLSGLALPPTGGSLGGTCAKDLVLAPDATCTLSLTYDTLVAHTTRPVVGAGVTADNVPAVAAVGSLSLAADLVPPTLKVAGRTTTDVGLDWSPGQSPQDDPVTGYELFKTMNGVSTAIPLGSAAARSWHGDPQRTNPFALTGWSVRLVTSSGRRSVLTPSVTGDTTLSADLGTSGGALVGGSTVYDASVVRLLDGGDLPSGTTVTGVAASADRRHLLLTLRDGNGGADALWLTDLRGQGRQVVDTTGVPAGTFDRAVLSPDGRKAAVSTTAGAIAVLDLSATPARTTVLASTGRVHAWSTDSARLLVLGGTLAGGQAAPAGLRWVSTATGASTALPGSATATRADVSRVGDVVWTQPGASAGSDQLQVLPAGAGASRLLWSPGTGCALGWPAYDPYGSALTLAVSGAGCVVVNGVPRTMWLGSSGSSPTVVLPVALDGPVAYTRVATTGPALALDARDANPADGQPPVTRGTVTIVPTVSDADDPVQALSATCSVDGAPATPCEVSTFTSPALPQGRHTLTMTVTDPAGHSSGPATTSWTVDTTAPTVTMGALPSVLSTSTDANYPTFNRYVGWTGVDNAGGSGIASYQGRYRYAFPTSPWSKQLPTISGMDQSSMDWTFQQGYSYCFSARAVDAAGNVGAWSPERCTSVVVDDSDFWSGRSVLLDPLRHSTAYTYGDLTLLAYGDYRSTAKSVSVRRLGVVMTTCPTCGGLEVWQGSRKLGVASGYSATKTYRVVRWFPATTTMTWGAITVKGASKGKVTGYDGLVYGK